MLLILLIDPFYWLVVLFGLFFALILWSNRREDLRFRQKAAELGFIYAGKEFPCDINLAEASFYVGRDQINNVLSGGDQIENVFKGSYQNREVVLFEYRRKAKHGFTQTVAAFEVPAESPFRVSCLIGIGGWEIEKSGRWVLVFQSRIAIEPEKLEGFMLEASSLLNTCLG